MFTDRDREKFLSFKKRHIWQNVNVEKMNCVHIREEVARSLGHDRRGILSHVA